MTIQLTDEQRILVDNLKHWYHQSTKPYYSYSGAPGTGKTTVIQTAVSELGLTYDEFITAAYVGKAVLVLLRKGLNASTIHSLIYYIFFEEEKPANDYEKPKVKMKFGLKPSLPPQLKLIVIDEAPMVNDKIKDQILSFGIPVVFVGDMNQLGPIFGTSSVMTNPDFILTQIMRQKENDPIVQFCQSILKDRPLINGIYGDSRIVDYIPFDERLLTDYDIIICGKNKTRDMINNRIREEILKRPSINPVVGDKLICRQNNWDEYIGNISLTNGLVGFVESIDKSTLYKGFMTIDFRPDFMDESFHDIGLDYNYIRLEHSERADYGMSSSNKFEYGYAITSHLSQGSEYDRVLYIREPFWNKSMTKRSAYTAISRAKKSITIVNNI